MSLNYDTERKLEAARLRRPTKVLLTENGHGPAGGGSWGSFRCPFCQHPTAAGVHAKAGPDRFRCFNNGGKKHAACLSDGRSLDEVGYRAMLTISSRRDALVRWLPQAGVREEGRERLGPGTPPGSRPRRQRIEFESRSPRPRNSLLWGLYIRGYKHAWRPSGAGRTYAGSAP